MDDFVWLTNPDTDGHFKCPAAAVPAWLENGWQVADAPPLEPDPVTAENLDWRSQQRPAAPAGETDKPSTTAARRGARNGEMSDG